MRKFESSYSVSCVTSVWVVIVGIFHNIKLSVHQHVCIGNNDRRGKPVQVAWHRRLPHIDTDNDNVGASE